ncbi:thioredoxin-dependent thiol peroxidase [Bacteroidota bacterium]
MAIGPGKKAPAFTAEIEGGSKISLKDFIGKWVVLYFYPKDNTPGCTNEACSFRDSMDVLTKMNTEVIGVSPDSVKSHDKFREKFNLNFHLLSDPEKKICGKYDVIAEKNMFGKKVKGVIRSTFLIDPAGNVRQVFSKVKVAGHTEEVMEALKTLQK